MDFGQEKQLKNIDRWICKTDGKTLYILQCNNHY